MPAVLITGSAGLIGSEAVQFYCRRGYLVIGVDNDMRRHLFGEDASTRWKRNALEYGRYFGMKTVCFRRGPRADAGGAPGPPGVTEAMSVETNLRAMQRTREACWRRCPGTSPVKLRWRALTVRHCFHVLPGESILELGAGSGLWTEHPATTLRRENPVDAAG